MQPFKSPPCHTKALSPCHTDYSCHTDSPPCHTDSHCHTERSEVSTMESRFFAIAQNDKENSIKQQT